MKRIFKIFSILLIALLLSNVHAEELLTTTTGPLDSAHKTIELKSRTPENKYGVNKKWQVTEDNMSNVMATKYVDASQKIYDFSDILTDDEEAELKAMIDVFIEKYNTELIIITDNYPYSSDEDNYYFVSDFYDYNDFGLNNPPKYDGIVIFRNTYEVDPFYTSARFGDAQLKLDENRNEAILDKIYYAMKSHQYLTAFKSYIESVSYYYEQGPSKEANNYYVDDDGYIHKNKMPSKDVLVGMATKSAIFGGVGALIALLIARSKNKMIIKATKADDYVNKVTYTKKVDEFVRTVTTSYTVSSSSGGGHGGGGFSSFGGSSGGGFSAGGRHG